MMAVMTRYRNNKQKTSAVILLAVLICYIVYYGGASLSDILQILILLLLAIFVVSLIFKPTLFILKSVFRVYKIYITKKYIRNTKDIDDLSWNQFEYYVAEKLKQRGYTNVRLTEKYDLGIDIIAEKDGIKWGVQVKHSKYPVKIEAVREAVAALNIYGCDRAMVVSNSSFTNPARELAHSNNCALVDHLASKD
jgi:restriction system protein